MAGQIVPHFHNSAGAQAIEIGVKEFQCMGALPPFDHPHVFLDMGSDEEIVCPYCSTVYRHKVDLAETESRPTGALFGAAQSSASEVERP